MQRRTFLQTLLGLFAMPPGTAIASLASPGGNVSVSGLASASPAVKALDARSPIFNRTSAGYPDVDPDSATLSDSLGTEGRQAITPRDSTAASASHRLLLQESPLAGFQYHAGERLWPLLFTGAPLALEREPHNPYDERATAIRYVGQRIGYIPRMENCAISQLMDRGEKLSVCIVALRESPNPWERVRLAVYWEGSPR